jgi:transposase-like protein
LAVVNSWESILQEDKMKKYSEEEKSMWLEDWKASGESASAYAKANGLNPQSLRNWEKAAAAPQNFVEVKAHPAGAVPVPESIRYMPEILIEKGDVRIHIPLSINRNELRSVIEGLGCQL